MEMNKVTTEETTAASGKVKADGTHPLAEEDWMLISAAFGVVAMLLLEAHLDFGLPEMGR
jgi:hypothetical protein